MSLRSALLLALLAAAPLRAQDDDGRDRPLEELEARLQEQRATALRARLVTYTDELEALHAKFTAAGDAAAATAVKTEMDAATVAMRQLANIARRQADPPAPDEVKADEELSATALAARRINGIIARFTRAKAAPRTTSSAPAFKVRQHILKFDKASRRSGYADSSSREYWGYDEIYALWSVKDIAPGTYEVILRYSADAGTGGKAVVRIAGTKLEAAIPKGEKSAREQKLSAGTVTITEPGADVRVESAGLTDKAESLWSLDSIVLQPVVKRP